MPKDKKSKEVTIIDMMNCRDRRAQIQREYLEQYKCPVLSFCMNIPGPVKTNTRIRRAFDEGKEELKKLNLPIKDTQEYHDITGDELIIAVDMEASKLKEKVTQIEERHPFGRLYDMDVIGTDGRKLSRSGFRRCLLCGRQAQECARQRRHSVNEMWEAINRMLE